MSFNTVFSFYTLIVLDIYYLSTIVIQTEID